MKELALHILDIAQNSIHAQATEIEITVIEDTNKDELKIEIRDNGIGMDGEMLKKVLDPFVTTRTTRKVGLGLSLFKAAAQRCEGDLIIDSKKGKGTVVTATFKHSHIDRAPLGNMADTIISLILSNENIDYIYTHFLNNEKFFLSTKDIKKALGNLSITEVEVLSWLREYINEGLNDLVKL